MRRPPAISRDWRRWSPPDTPARLPYQAQALIRFTGRLHHASLHRALQSVVDRHDVLSSTFPKVRGRWVQQIHPEVTVALPIVDLRAETDPERALDALIAERFRERIDVTELPLVRWTLALLADDRAALIQVEHHVIHDGWSFATMLEEIETLYRAYAAGDPDPLPRLSVQYADFAAWQHAFVRSEGGHRQLEYWTRALADHPAPPRLPTDRPAPAVRSYRGRSLRWELDAELIDALRRTASRSGCTPYMVMVTGYLALLSRLSGETDLLIGSGLANRRLTGTEPLIGMIVNTVALRVDLSEDPSVEDMLARVRTAALGAQPALRAPLLLPRHPLPRSGDRWPRGGGPRRPEQWLGQGRPQRDGDQPAGSELEQRPARR